jgi:hypothetical protein
VLFVYQEPEDRWDNSVQIANIMAKNVVSLRLVVTNKLDAAEEEIDLEMMLNATPVFTIVMIAVQLKKKHVLDWLSNAEKGITKLTKIALCVVIIV